MSTYNVIAYGKDGKTAIVELSAISAEIKWVPIDRNGDCLSPDQLMKFRALQELYND